MRIVIDGRFWGPKHTGLGIYTRELVKNLAKIDSRNQYYIFLRREALGNPEIPKKFQKIIVEASAYSLKEQLLVAFKLYQIKPDLVHFPSINLPVLYFGKFVVTVHDLIKHDFRGSPTTTRQPLVYWPKYLVYRFVSWWAIHRGCRIIVPSNDVKEKVIQKYAVNPEKITVTYESAVLSAGRETPVSLPEKFVFYVGNAYPHKNLPRLIRAMDDVYSRTGAKLAIASGRNIFLNRLTKMANPNVVLLGHLGDDELAYVYQRAQSYVFPSLAEGFGLPALDAMKFGVPVVCSNLPVFHEIYGPAALYFDAHDERDIAQKVIEVLTNPKLKLKLVALGHLQAAKYSWAKLASQTLEVYNAAIKYKQ